MIPAYRQPDRAHGDRVMRALIDALSRDVPAGLTELVTLSPTLERAADVLAYVERPGTSNGPTEAIHGRLEHLRRSPSDSAPHPLHRQIPARDRRVQTPTAPSIVKSRIRPAGQTATDRGTAVDPGSARVRSTQAARQPCA